MLKKVVWFVASFAITLLLLEGGVTIYTVIRGIELPLYEDFPDRPSSYGTFGASLGWALKPSTAQAGAVRRECC